jgi:hypothetical protein
MVIGTDDCLSAQPAQGIYTFKREQKTMPRITEEQGKLTQIKTIRIKFQRKQHDEVYARTFFKKLEKSV